MNLEKLIAFVRDSDVLYNSVNKEYRNLEARAEAWNEIGLKLSFSGNECKETWNKLRNSHTNALKRRKIAAGHQTAKNIPNWKYEEQMAFLLPNLQCRKLKYLSMASFIWKLFEKNDSHPELAKCIVCDKITKRGAAECGPKGYGTTSMHNHARIQHPKYYAEAKGPAGKSKPSTSGIREKSSRVTPKNIKLTEIRALKQLCFKETLESPKTWDVTNPKSLEVHKRIALMMALDNQPFSIVEDPGFIGLMAHLQPRYLLPSRSFFSDKFIPNLYEEIKTKISKHLEEANFISFTSDIWTCSTSHESFISLTGHWIDNNYERKNAVLHASHFAGSHKGALIAEKFHTMWVNWDLDEMKRYILVKDDASNVALGTDLSVIKSVHCTIHLIQLVINDGILSQETIKDLIDKSRKLATHLNQSNFARNEFKQIQKDRGLGPLLLVQDVATRWNSVYLMLERMLKLKKTVQLFLAEHTDLLLFTSNEWQLTDNLVHLLQPFFQLTKEMSSECATLSTVIPNICILIILLSRVSDRDKGVETTKEELLKSVRKRFFTDKIGSIKSINIFASRIYVLATVIDPRFKLGLLPKDKREQAKSWITEEILLHETLPENQSENFMDDRNSNASTSDDPFASYFLEMTDDFRRETKKTKKEKEKSSVSLIEVVEEINNFSQLPLLDRKMCPLNYWKNEFRFPMMKKLVPKLLATPASSVYSEEIYSKHGNIFESSRSKILPKRGEMLLFIHHNGRKFP